MKIDFIIIKLKFPTAVITIFDESNQIKENHQVSGLFIQIYKRKQIYNTHSLYVNILWGKVKLYTMEPYE